LQPNTDTRIDAPTIGKVLLKARGLYTEDYWYWICIGALVGFSLLFNFLFILALTYLNRKLYSFDFNYNNQIIFSRLLNPFNVEPQFQRWVIQKH